MVELPKNQKIVFFSPHPDDDAISAGALLYSLVHRYHNQVACVYVTTSPKGVIGNSSTEEKAARRRSEARQACRVMGTKPVFLDLDQPVLKVGSRNIETIKDLLQKEKPAIIFLPPKSDAHPTHRKVAALVSKAVRALKSVKQIWFYDTWTPLAKPNFIFFFQKDLQQIKTEAIRQHQSQLARLDCLTLAEGLNIFRGEMGKELMAGFGQACSKKKQYGEAFFIREKPL